MKMDETDLELLTRYARDNAEDAFAELLRRHIDLVHSAALRQVRSPQLAEEVAQSAFLKLVRHASQLPSGTVLTAWLYQVTRREAIDLVRKEARRHLREQIATEMNAINATPDDWAQVEPLLDEAMHGLDDTDRTAILLRYFENKPLREVGQTLGTSEDAAQKRVGRALDRLRAFFGEHGISVGAGSLFALISANAVQAAPVGLSMSIITATFAGKSIATAAAGKAITMSTLQKGLVGFIAVSVSTAIIVQHRGNESLRTENTALRAQTNQLVKLIPLASEEQAAARLASGANELHVLNNEHSELLRLRGETALLRRQVAQLTQQPQGTLKPNPAAGKPNVVEEAGAIKFAEVPLKEFIPIYADMAELKLEMSPQLPLDGTITIEQSNLTRSEAVALVEKALAEQAGLSVRRSTPGHATLLFDSSLMVNQVKFP
jgi:RNA polymerase sigma factor (sigma-70 family)